MACKEEWFVGARTLKQAQDFAMVLLYRHPIRRCCKSCSPQVCKKHIQSDLPVDVARQTSDWMKHCTLSTAHRLALAEDLI